MDKSIKINIKFVYGAQKAYPACKDSKLFADMLNAKTLTHAALCKIEQLGYKIETVGNPHWRDL